VILNKLKRGENKIKNSTRNFCHKKISQTTQNTTKNESKKKVKLTKNKKIQEKYKTAQTNQRKRRSPHGETTKKKDLKKKHIKPLPFSKPGHTGRMLNWAYFRRIRKVIKSAKPKLNLGLPLKIKYNFGKTDADINPSLIKSYAYQTETYTDQYTVLKLPYKQKKERLLDFWSIENNQNFMKNTIFLHAGLFSYFAHNIKSYWGKRKFKFTTTALRKARKGWKSTLHRIEKFSQREFWRHDNSRYNKIWLSMIKACLKPYIKKQLQPTPNQRIQYRTKKKQNNKK
jgi:hypothetical protein